MLINFNTHQQHVSRLAISKPLPSPWPQQAYGAPASPAFLWPQNGPAFVPHEARSQASGCGCRVTDRRAGSAGPSGRAERTLVGHGPDECLQLLESVTDFSNLQKN